MKVQSTTDYGMFKRVKGNRLIDKAHVTKLTKSILRKNLLGEYPIVVTPKFEIIDGQHRLEVARNNKLPIYYSIIEGLDIKDIQQLNIAIKPWSYKDYLRSYTEQGYSEYIKLTAFVEESGLSISNAGMIIGSAIRPGLTDPKGVFFKGAYTSFKSGGFRAENWERGTRFLILLTDLMPYLKFEVLKQERQLTGTILKLDWMVEEGLIDWKQMLTQFDKTGRTIERHYTIRDYLRFFEDIYNFGQHNIFRFI